MKPRMDTNPHEWEASSEVQLDLFSPVAARIARKKKGQPNGYAAAPGSGPAGESCGSCGHVYRRASGSGKVFRKCDLVRETSGPGSDIVLKSPACARWEAKGQEVSRNQERKNQSEDV